jgi:hypothetical protein
VRSMAVHGMSDQLLKGALAAGVELEENREVDKEDAMACESKMKENNGESRLKRPKTRYGTRAWLVIGRSNKGKGEHAEEKREKLWVIIAFPVSRTGSQVYIRHVGFYL